MDKKLKTRWVKALRSGKFAQGDALLYEGHRDTYCCLGVLCRVAGASKDQIDDRTMPARVAGYETVIDEKIAGVLANLNDDGVPFEVIAGLIQEAL